MAYECLYCGKAIAQDEILFVDETSILYEDAVREEFFRRCGMLVVEGKAKFNRLYHRANSQNIDRRDENGFPRTIYARPCDGLTADELTQTNVAVQVQEETVAPKEEESGGFGSESYEGFGEMENSPITSSSVNTIIKPDSTEKRILSIRVCPHCHCNLPHNFGLLPVYSVQILGGRAAGKTAFLICLHQQLNRQLSNNQLGTAELLDESRLYLDPKVRFYEENGTPQPTKAAQKIFPLVYHIIAKHNREQKEAFISFHDVAGEGMGRDDYLFNLSGLSRSRNLLYMIDPNQLNGGGYYDAYRRIVAENDQNQPDLLQNSQTNVLEAAFAGGGESTDFCETELNNAISRAGAVVSDVYGSRKPNNIFVVMNKMDMPLMVETRMFGKGKLAMMYDIGDLHKGIINGDILNRIDKEVNRFVAAKANMNSDNLLTQTIADSFDCEDHQIHVCCISTHTRVQGTPNRPIMFANKYNVQDSKHRIIEPFLCMMYHFGLLPAKFGEEIDWQQNEEDFEKTSQNDNKKKPRKGLFGKAK